MKLDYLYEILSFIILVLLQVLVFNQISIFGLATPFIYIYFILKLPIGRNIFYVIIMGFLLGTIIDIFLDTPGINATATTIVATLRKPLLRLFFTKEEFEEFVPSIHSAPGAFFKFSLVAVSLHQIVLFSLEALSLFNFNILLLRLISSIVLTMTILISLDGFKHKSFSSEQ